MCLYRVYYRVNATISERFKVAFRGSQWMCLALMNHCKPPPPSHWARNALSCVGDRCFWTQSRPRLEVVPAPYVVQIYRTLNERFNPTSILLRACSQPRALPPVYLSANVVPCQHLPSQAPHFAHHDKAGLIWTIYTQSGPPWSARRVSAIKDILPPPPSTWRRRSKSADAQVLPSRMARNQHHKGYRQAAKLRLGQ